MRLLAQARSIMIKWTDQLTRHTNAREMLCPTSVCSSLMTVNDHNREHPTQSIHVC